MVIQGRVLWYEAVLVSLIQRSKLSWIFSRLLTKSKAWGIQGWSQDFTWVGAGVSAKFFSMTHNSVHSKSTINNQTLIGLYLFYIHFTQHSRTDPLSHTPIHPTYKQWEKDKKKKKFKKKYWNNKSTEHSTKKKCIEIRESERLKSEKQKRKKKCGCVGL